MARTPRDPNRPKGPTGRIPVSVPNPAAVPLRTRKAMYEAFRGHTDEVRETLLGILRDEEADNGHRIQAGKEILNRGWGQAPSIEIVEQVFKHQHSFDVDALHQLPAKELAALESVLTKLLRTDADVIDADYTEHKP